MKTKAVKMKDIFGRHPAKDKNYDEYMIDGSNTTVYDPDQDVVVIEDPFLKEIPGLKWIKKML